VKPTLVLLGLSVWLSAPQLVLAQQSTASLNGTVRDTTGLVVGDATLALRNIETNVERRTVSNALGDYAFVNVPPGRYTVEASKTGFATMRVKPFTLAVSQIATIDVSLNVGSVSETVTVSAVGAEVESSSAELGAVVETKNVEDLPLNNRNFTQLLLLTPGASDINVSQNSGGTQAAAIGTFSFPAMNGQPNRSNLFTTDGIANYGMGSTYAVPPIVDTIQEFKVQSHSDQAEFGQNLGGTVTVATKSGTNTLHGSAWEYVRNTAFDAENFFHRLSNVLKQNMFGGTLGGPVVVPRLYNGRNRTFYHIGYQGFTQRSPANATYRIPTPANYAGNFSDWPQQIFDPSSTRLDPVKAGAFVRDPFPGNVIPVSRLDQGLIRYARATLPEAAVNTGIVNQNGLDLTGVRLNNHEYNVRVDENLGVKDFVFFRYSGRQQNSVASGGRQALVSTPEFVAYNYGGSWVHTFGPSAVLQMQLGKSNPETRTRIRLRDRASDLLQQVGIDTQFGGGFNGGYDLMPGMNVAGYFSGGETGGVDQQNNLTQGKVTFSKIHGHHTFKMGFEVNSVSYHSISQQIYAAFSNIQTGNPQSPGSTGSALASFFLNIPDNALRRDTISDSRFGGVIGTYFQDQWKATPRLTVNIGMRYDRLIIPAYGTEGTDTFAAGSLDLNNGTYILQAVPPPCEQKKKAPCIPTAGGVLPDKVVVSPDGLILHGTTKNFQPRVGLAYRIGPRTALRASFGVFFDEWAALIQNSRNYQGSWPAVTYLQSLNLNYPTATQLLPSVSAKNPFAGGSTLPAATPWNQVAYYPDPLLKNPYSLQWNFGLQHQLSQSTTVTANYVGSGTRRLDLGGLYNVALTPGPGTPQSRSLYPYIRATNYNRSWSRSNYEAAQLQFKRAFSSGLAATAAFTWSKAIDIGCSGWFGVEGCAVQDPYHFNNDRSLSAFDQTFAFVSSVVYELPIGIGKPLQTGRRALDYVIGNWQVNGIVTLRSGQPFTPVVSGDVANTGNSSYMRPNVVGDWRLDNPTPQKWFNTAAFAAPSLYSFGNSGRNILRSDGRQTADASVFRIFPLREGMRLRLEVMAFNIFNSAIFSTPGATLGSGGFGVVSSTFPARQLQFALKLQF
jgi:hypothetical protein